MKNIIICFFIMLVCSCSNYQDKNRPNASYVPMTRKDEIIMTMRNHWIKSYESFTVDPQMCSDLRKMKKDYYYDVNDRDTNLTIPGLKWEIRGPLMIEQVEQESLDNIKKYPDVPQVPFGYINDKWNALKSKYKDGDEFFYYLSDPLSWNYLRGESGYILIRQNKVVGKIVGIIS
jgi:hypothetical protein